MKFTVKSIPRLQLPEGKTDHIEWDDDLPGFGIRLRQGGSRSWVFQYALGQKQRRMSIGSATGIPLVKAREIASELHAKVRLGNDPAGQKVEDRQKAAETFEAIGRLWLARKKENLRPGSYRHLERHVLKYGKPLYGLQLASLGRRTIGSTLETVGSRNGKVAANRMQATLSEFFTWAWGEGYVDKNPLAGREAFGEKARERVLEDKELAEIWRHAGDDHYGSILKLLMLTGQRADEMASLRRSEIGKADVKEARLGDVKLPAFRVDAIELPPERTKNKRRHIIPLSKPVLAILNKQPQRLGDDGNVRDLIFGVGQQGFSGWSRCKKRLDERIHDARLKAWEEADGRGEKPAPMRHWTPHDLRRTMVTVMNDRLNVLPHVVECTVNHVSSAQSGKSGVSGTYNYAIYLRERVEALKLWSDHIMALVGANVVSLRRATP